MPAPDRDILAELLAQQFESGVFVTLRTLESFRIPPFDTAYEGSPFTDFVGRLNDWEWPEP